jgi:type IV pilus assembly protein PilZ
VEKGYSLIMSGRGSGDSEKPSTNGGPVTAGASVTSSTSLTSGAVLDLGDDRDCPPSITADDGGHADDRRSTERIDVLWSVDCETDDTFLYAAITNISEMGIFVRTTEPLAVGTAVTLRFAPPQQREPFVLGGVVQWVNPVRPRADNPNPGMGIRFSSLTLADRERIVDSIRTIAYLREEPRPKTRDWPN